MKKINPFTIKFFKSLPLKYCNEAEIEKASKQFWFAYVYNYHPKYFKYLIKGECGRDFRYRYILKDKQIMKINQTVHEK